MKLKYHAEVSNLKEAVPYYANLFEGKIVKDGSVGGHGCVMLFGEIQLTLHTVDREIEKTGELVLRFEEGQGSKMDELMERVKADESCKTKYGLRLFPWGTELYSFQDKYGYTWTLER